MSDQIPPLESQSQDATGVRARKAELARSNQALQAELSRAHELSLQLGRQILAPFPDDNSDRQIRRAALNLMEDAIAARTRALEANEELLEKIAEQHRVEAALRETERELQEAIERHQQLNIELDRRVRERTRELADREGRLRELSAELQRVEQKERQRLATLLHDHVQQLLVAAKLRVDLIAGQSAEPARSRLNDVVAMLGDAINATRDLSVQLAPPLLHDQGLAAALDWLVARLRNMHGLVVEQDFDPEADPRTETGRDILFHTAHELLLNVVKHSKTSAVQLSLSRDNGYYRLEIVDQGIGFEAIRSTQRGSFGLFQLRQRLENAAGTLVVDSHPGQGTRVIATLPDGGVEGIRSKEIVNNY